MELIERLKLLLADLIEEVADKVQFISAIEGDGSHVAIDQDEFVAIPPEALPLLLELLQAEAERRAENTERSEALSLQAEGYHRCPDGVWRKTPSNGMFDGLCGHCEIAHEESAAEDETLFESHDGATVKIDSMTQKTVEQETYYNVKTEEGFEQFAKAMGFESTKDFERSTGVRALDLLDKYWMMAMQNRIFTLEVPS